MDNLLSIVTGTYDLPFDSARIASEALKELGEE